jgi:uncharacterized protein (DUF302 family)
MASDADPGIVNVPSAHSVDDIVNALTATLQAKGITPFALVDHSGEAAQVGIAMRPTKLLIFGGTRRRQIRVGLDWLA